MPLSDLISHFNAADRAGESTLAPEAGRTSFGCPMRRRRLAGIDLGQGDRYGTAQADCLATHAGRRVA